MRLRGVPRGPIRLLLLAAAVAAGASGCGSGGKPARPDLLFVSSKGGHYGIYEMSADGSHEHLLMSDSTSAVANPNLDPAWSPDGRRIAFASMRDGTSDIFVMDASGKHIRRLTSTADDDTHPTWSPDGKRIAFVRGGHGAIEVMDADGSHVRRLTTDTARQDDPAWSPNGRWIAYARNTILTTSTEIWLAHPDGSGQRQLTSLNAASTWPTWSPDGRSIAFSSAFGGTSYAIYAVRIGAKKARRLTASTSDEFQPAWSPDGTRIAFVRDGAIVVANVDGTSEEAITKASDNDSEPVWNPVPAPKKGS